MRHREGTRVVERFTGSKLRSQTSCVLSSEHGLCIQKGQGSKSSSAVDYVVVTKLCVFLSLFSRL